MAQLVLKFASGIGRPVRLAFRVPASAGLVGKCDSDSRLRGNDVVGAGMTEWGWERG